MAAELSFGADDCLSIRDGRLFMDDADLGELADAAEEVAAGEAKLVPMKGLFGEDVIGADHGHFQILVAKDFKA